jgi:ribosomal protein L37AE/L43A
MTNCPFCSDRLLRHIRGHESYWFCRTCWQETPMLSTEKRALHSENAIAKLSTRTQKLEKRATVYNSNQQTKVA